MNFLQMKTAVALQLANMKSNHPFYSSLGSYVNQAVKELPRRAIRPDRQSLGLFPELLRKAIETTIADQSWLALPASCLAPLNVFSFDDPAVPDEDDDKTSPVHPIPYEYYEYLEKSSTLAQYPSLWAWIGERIYIYPTPRTGKTTYIRLYYLHEEEDMSADGDTPFLKTRWHQAVVDLACYIAEMKMTHPQRAAHWLASVDNAIGATVDITALTTTQQAKSLEAEGIKDIEMRHLNGY